MGIELALEFVAAVAPLGEAASLAGAVGGLGSAGGDDAVGAEQDAVAGDDGAGAGVGEERTGVVDGFGDQHVLEQGGGEVAQFGGCVDDVEGGEVGDGGLGGGSAVAVGPGAGGFGSRGVGGDEVWGDADPAVLVGLEGVGGAAEGVGGGGLEFGFSGDAEGGFDGSFVAIADAEAGEQTRGGGVVGCAAGRVADQFAERGDAGGEVVGFALQGVAAFAQIAFFRFDLGELRGGAGFCFAGGVERFGGGGLSCFGLGAGGFERCEFGLAGVERRAERLGFAAELGLFGCEALGEGFGDGAAVSGLLALAEDVVAQGASVAQARFSGVERCLGVLQVGGGIAVGRFDAEFGFQVG